MFDAERAAESGSPFKSVLSLDLQGIIDPRFVHVTYGASKDFCANGLRLGVLQTRNTGLLEAVASLRCVPTHDVATTSTANKPPSPFSWPPYIIQDIWAGILEDETYRRDFVQRNHDLMAKSYRLATSLLEQNNIPYFRKR